MKYLDTYAVFEKKYGFQLFGSKLGKWPIWEPDGREEAKIRELIRKFTGSMTYTGDNLNPEFIEAMNKLKSIKNEYPEVLVPEDIYVYRGIKIDFGKLIEICGSHISKDANPFSGDLKESFKMNYKPKSAVESWSTDEKIGKQFATPLDAWGKPLINVLEELGKFLYESMKDKNKNEGDLPKLLFKKYCDLLDISHDHRFYKSFYDIIMGSPTGLMFRVKTNGDFIFKSKYFKKISANPKEDETLRISKEPIECDCFLNGKYIMNYTIPFLIKYKKELSFQQLN